MLKKKFTRISAIAVIILFLIIAYFLLDSNKERIPSGKINIKPEIFSNKKTFNQKHNLNPPVKNSQVEDIRILAQWKQELIESEKNRVRLFYNSVTNFSSELCFKIDNLPQNLVSEWDQKLDLILSRNQDSDITERVNELRDFVHWEKDNDTGKEFRTRVVTVSLKTGPEGEDNWVVTVTEADEATGGSTDGRNWTRLTGNTKMRLPSQNFAKSRYGHLFVFGDEK